MKPRYIKQPNPTACGPTVVINALKWAGIAVSAQSDFGFIADMCEYEPEDGSSFSAINSALRLLMPPSVKVYKPRNVQIEDIKSHVENGGACVSSISNWSDMCHIFLITGYSEGFFTVHNFRETEPTSFIRKKTLQKDLLSCQNWFLSRR